MSVGVEAVVAVVGRRYSRPSSGGMAKQQAVRSELAGTERVIRRVKEIRTAGALR